MRTALADGAGQPTRRTPFAPVEDSPFLPLGHVARFGFLFYLFAYRLVFPLLDASMDAGSHDLFELRFAAEVFYTCLLAYPFICYRREYGWLHPLVLPVLWQVGKGLAKNPLSLIFPFDLPTVDFAVETVSKAAVLSLSNYDLAWYRLDYTLILILAQCVYLAVFLFGVSFKVPRLPVYRPSSVALPAMIFIAALMGLAAVFVMAKGGISEMLVAMRGGRRALFEGYGEFVAGAQMAPFIALTWFVYETKPFRNPLFLAGLALALLASLIVTGSRSSVVLSGFMLILLWWWREGRAIILPTMMAVLFGVIVVGGFGAIRQDYNSTEIDLSVFSPSQISQTIERAYTEIGRRDDEDSNLAVISSVDQKGLLWGRTYVNAATFWIPRSMWPDKPVGADVYNNWINFNDNKIGVAPPNLGTWGIPVDAQAEAYWNFGWFGVVGIFALLGAFHSTLAKAAHVYRAVPIFWVVYIYMLIYVVGTSRSVSEMLKVVMVILLFALVSGIIPWGKQRKNTASAGASAA